MGTPSGRTGCEELRRWDEGCPPPPWGEERSRQCRSLSHTLADWTVRANSAKRPEPRQIRFVRCRCLSAPWPDGAAWSSLLLLTGTSPIVDPPKSAAGDRISGQVVFAMGRH